jgi:hypothetical protein
MLRDDLINDIVGNSVSMRNLSPGGYGGKIRLNTTNKTPGPGQYNPDDRVRYQYLKLLETRS